MCVCVCVCAYVYIRVDRNSRICEAFIFTVSERSCRIDDVLPLFYSYEDFKTNMKSRDCGTVDTSVLYVTAQYT